MTNTTSLKCATLRIITYDSYPNSYPLTLNFQTPFHYCKSYSTNCLKGEIYTMVDYELLDPPPPFLLPSLPT